MAVTEAGYSISEVAGLTGLTAHTLRWYEQIGMLSRVDREAGGRRRYDDADLRRLEFVGKLRMTGMPVADMVRYSALCDAGDHTRPERLAILEAHREEVRRRITDLTGCLLVLDYKIDFYAGSS
jgi:DNA-binding transcriptional MerR regulator